VARQQLGAYSERVDREMAEVVEREVGDAWLRSAVGYHLGWLDAQDGRFEPRTSPPAGGKKLRATLAVLAYRAAAATATAAPVPAPPADDLERIAPLAAALELFHNWTLVHDDIEDGDRMRRGRPALWTVCGVAQAVNVGDAIHSLTGRCLARLGDRGVPGPQVAELMAEMSRTGVELTTGQARDLAFEATTDIDRHRYLEMVGGKTAALMRYATYGGAVLGSGDARAFGEFGRRLGLAFQIRDDVLGIWGTDAEAGKPTGSDIRRRKKSLPVVLAFERTAEPDRSRLEALYAQDAPLTSADEQFVRQALDRCGARELAQACARRHRDEALAALDRATNATVGAGGGRPAARPHLVALRALADFVTERSH
jgi:geranylgeranyl diphosphate synthase type I